MSCGNKIYLSHVSSYRVRKEGDSIEEKLTVACSDIVSKLDDTLLSPGTGGTIQNKIKL